MACHTSRAPAVSGGWAAVESPWRSALAAKKIAARAELDALTATAPPTGDPILLTRSTPTTERNPYQPAPVPVAAPARERRDGTDLTTAGACPCAGWD
jgi:hypothetical protein